MRASSCSWNCCACAARSSWSTFRLASASLQSLVAAFAMASALSQPSLASAISFLFSAAMASARPWASLVAVSSWYHPEASVRRSLARCHSASRRSARAGREHPGHQPSPRVGSRCRGSQAREPGAGAAPLHWLSPRTKRSWHPLTGAQGAPDPSPRSPSTARLGRLPRWPAGSRG